MTAASRRRSGARVCAVLGAIALFVGAIYAWASPTLFDSDKFAARARHSLETSPALRRVVAQTLVVSVIEQQKADLIAFRPILTSAAESIVGTNAFEDVFELAVRGAHQFFTEPDSDTMVVRANEAALLLIDTVRIIAPEVAAAIPVNLEPALLRLRHASTERQYWERADRVEFLAVVLPILGVLLWAAAVLLAPDRRRMLGRLGVTTTALGVVMIVGLRIGGRLVSSAFELPLNQQAARDVWDVYVDGLQAIAWFGVLGGLILAAAVRATSAERSRLSPAHLRETAVALVTREPRSRWGKVVAGSAVLLVGIALFVAPFDVLGALLTALGAFLFYGALVYILEVLVQPGQAGVADEQVAVRQGRVRALGVAGGLGVALIVGVGLYLIFSSPSATAGLQVCNGRIEFCTRRLDEVVFPTTHNSPTAAEDGFLLPNQERGMAKQLRDGVRGFQIDTYLGTVRTNGGTSVVFTNLTDDKLLTIEDAVGPELAAQALQFRQVVGPPPANAREDVYLCHNFCELGAVKMSDEVDTFRRFLERNPTDVIIWIIQDEMPAEELLPVLKAGRLDRYIATIDPTKPLPTLAEMIASGRRLVIGLENGDLGPQILNVFDDGLVQEVRYNYRTVDELLAPDSCLPLRGRRDAPLFQFNHWVTPASLRAAREINTVDFLGGRARRCQSERDLIPNLLAVDFYESGGLFPVAEALNADE